MGKMYQFFQRGSMLESIQETNKKTMNQIGQMFEAIDDDRNRRDRLKEEITSLDNIRTELGNAEGNVKGTFPKTMWSKYYLTDRKKWLEATKARDDCAKAVRYFEGKVEECALKINEFDRDMEGQHAEKEQVIAKKKKKKKKKKSTRVDTTA